MKKIIFLLFLALGITACAPQFPVLEDTSIQTPTDMPPATQTPQKTETTGQINKVDFLSDNPCTAPCFFGITPGLSTEVEVNTFIADYGSVFRDCYSEDDSGNENVRWILCEEVAISVSEGYVNRFYYFLNPPLTLQQVINVFGPPDLLAVFSTSIPEESLIITAVLYFDKTQTILYLPDIEGKQYEITPDIMIYSLHFFSASEYNDRASNIGKSIKRITWNGYGIYGMTE